jgi:DMSO/TMAO reductase YedYZ molybdopterin-dependent catalytic subunit
MTIREGINYPKFKDQFALMDFEANPLPVLSLFSPPPATPLEAWRLLATDLEGRRRTLSGPQLATLPRVREKAPLVCQIFNWAEEPQVEGVRLADALEALGVDVPEGGYFAFYSADGLYFEGLPREMARDPRVLLVFGLNGEPLPHQYGGPIRLWVPFLQGYKSVKWVHLVRAFRRDPIGIKRLLGQSKTAILGANGQEKASIVVARPSNGESVPEV